MIIDEQLKLRSNKNLGLWSIEWFKIMRALHIIMSISVFKTKKLLKILKSSSNACYSIMQIYITFNPDFIDGIQQ